VSFVLYRVVVIVMLVVVVDVSVVVVFVVVVVYYLQLLLFVCCSFCCCSLLLVVCSLLEVAVVVCWLVVVVVAVVWQVVQGAWSSYYRCVEAKPGRVCAVGVKSSSAEGHGASWSKAQSAACLERTEPEVLPQVARSPGTELQTDWHQADEVQGSTGRDWSCLWWGML